MEFEFSPKVLALRQQLLAFMNEHVYPNDARHEAELAANAKAGRPYAELPMMAGLKAQAREQGLWNLFLPPHPGGSNGAAEAGDTGAGGHGPGRSNVEYAPLAEIMGRRYWCSEIFNCSAPDTGNMEVLARYGTKAQQERWLTPLLAGQIRSAFAMTEPDVASSDATNIACSIRREGDEYVINGRKWYITGAMNERCEIFVLMGKTDPDHADRHRQQSMVLVPKNTPGVTIVRDMALLGVYDPPFGDPEIRFENVRVPVENILLGEGRGFEIAQGRLGPGRIHHCMRAIGMAEAALELMCQRLASRTAFHKLLADQGVWRERIAESRMLIEQSRWMVLNAAWRMDTVGNKVAAKEIAMIKVLTPNNCVKVIDWAMQAFGAMGLSQDTPLTWFYAYERHLRVADGPDEVHRNAIAKQELAAYL